MKSAIVITFLACILCGCGPSKEEKEQYWREQTIVFKNLYNNHQYEQALALAKKRVKLAEEEFAGSFRLSNAYNDLALIYRDLHYNQESEKYFLKALQIPNKAGNDIATIYDNLSTLCRNMERYEQALEYSKKAIAEYEQDKNSDSTRLCIAKLGLVESLLIQQDYTTSSQLIRQVYEYGIAKADSSLILDAIESQVSLYLFSSREEEALPYLTSLQTIYQQNRRNLSLATTYNQLGAVYFARKDYDLALKQYHKAAQLKFNHYQDSTFIAIEMKNVAFTYRTKGDSANSARYWIIYERIKK